LGKRLRLFISGKEPTPWLTVVGVVSNIVQNDRTRQVFDPLVYVPYEQRPQPNMFAFARTSVAPRSLATAVRRQIYAMDPYLPVPALTPLAERFDRAYAFERNITVLFLVFAVVALLLASVGLYATISHSVRKRTQEIGIRVAIGATVRDVFMLVFRQGVLPVGMGLTIGLAVSLAVNRVLKSQLVGVSPGDPVALVAASAVLVLSAALGSAASSAAGYRRGARCAWIRLSR
jgi:ABC-type antimicrobial peptide transport system permease subunit